MADKSPTPNLKSFSATTDQNGQQMGQDSPVDLARPSDLTRRLEGDPSGEAETARLASGFKSEDAELETAAETPPENLRHISDPHITPPTGAAGEAIERATAGLGKPE